ncbi:hypothetical protein HK096_004054 [Nowakowskiella sp. JEL0078]|nr:hypothetical protein HK096_004054 [Nowakowskiella sp. JEL0078]
MHVYRPGRSPSISQSSGINLSTKPLEQSSSSQVKHMDPPLPLRRSVSLTGVGPYVYKKKEPSFIEPEVIMQPNLNRRGSLLFSLIRSKSMGKRNDSPNVGMNQRNMSMSSFWKSKTSHGESTNEADLRHRDISPSGPAKVFRSRSFLQKKRNLGVELPSETEVPEAPSLHRRVKSQSSTPNFKKDGGVILNGKNLIKGLFLKDSSEEHTQKSSVPLCPSDYESTDDSDENFQLPDPRCLLSKSTDPITWTSESGTLYSSDGIESMSKQWNNWKGSVNPPKTSVLSPEGSIRSLSPTGDYPTNVSKCSINSESQETLNPTVIRFTPHGSNTSLNSMVNDFKPNSSPPRILKSPLLVLNDPTEISKNSAFPQPTPLRSPKRSNSQSSTRKPETETHQSPLRIDTSTEDSLTDEDTLGRVSRLSVKEVIDWQEVSVVPGTGDVGEQGTIDVVDSWYDAAKDMKALDDVWYTPPDFLSMPRRRVVSTFLDENSSIAKEKLDVLLDSITVFDEYFTATEKELK